MSARSQFSIAAHRFTQWGSEVLGLDAQGASEILPRQEKLRTASIVGVIVTLAYAWFHIAIAGFWTLGWLQLGIVVFLFTPALVLAARDISLPLSELLLMAGMTIMFASLLIFGGIEATGIYWIFIYPLVAFFITGQRNGWLWCFGFMAIALLIRWTEWFSGQGFSYTFAQIQQQTFAFLFYTVAASLFNRIRTDFEHHLQDTVLEKAAAADGYQQQLQHRTLHDGQTGLPNRKQFFSLLTQQIEQFDGNGKLTVAYIKLERILEIANIVGNDESGKLIQDIASDLLNRLEPGTLLARTGYDEFAIAFRLHENENEARYIQNLMDHHHIIHHMNGQLLHIEYTLGLCSYPEFASGSDQLLRRAEQAMMRAHKKRLPVLRYETGLEESFIRHHLLYGKLMRALEENHLTLAYQPQMDMTTGKLLGAEALARWRDPEEGWISPAEFIPVAEQSGLIHPLTHWLIRESIAQCAYWHSMGLPLDISLNLSARNFDDPDLMSHLLGALHDTQADPNWITLELTESAFMDSPDKAMRIVRQFREMGFRISIDDFGTGYSSFAYLKDLNADELKIDRSFIVNLPHSQNDVTIVQTIIQLAHNLGLKVVAEGIETAAISAQLQELGCDIAQGYYYGKPVSPGEFLEQAIANHASESSPDHHSRAA